MTAGQGQGCAAAPPRNQIGPAPMARNMTVATRDPRLTWAQPFDLPCQGVFDGAVSAERLRDGLGVHVTDAVALRSFETEAMRSPGMVLHCFLEGETEARLGGRQMGLGRRPGEPVRLVLTSLDQPELFWRRSAPGEYVRKVNILMSRDWLDDNGLGLRRAGADGLRQSRRLEWTATSDDILAAETLVKLNGGKLRGCDDPVRRMQAESVALGLVARAFETLTGQMADSGLSQAERAQLARMEELALNAAQMPSLSQMARAGGVSLAKMRRLFHAAHGVTVQGYIRTQRLTMARRALETRRVTVAQAAELAGYGSAENFATAFRRLHGLSPSQVRRGQS